MKRASNILGAPAASAAIAMAIVLAPPATTTAPAASPEPPAAAATAPAATQEVPAQLPPPTTVSLHLKDATAKEAFVRLFEQAGLRTDQPHALLVDDERRFLTVDLEDVPFLLALRELCVRCDAEPTADPFPRQVIAVRQRGRRFSETTTTTTTAPTSSLIAADPATRDPAAPDLATTDPATTDDAGAPREQTTPPDAPPPASGPVRSIATRRAPLDPADLAWDLRMQERFEFATTLPAGAPPPLAIGGPYVLRGPLMFVPRYASRLSTHELTAGAGERPRPRQSMQFTLQTFADPKLRLFGIAPALAVDEAVDERGRSLIRERARPSEPYNVRRHGWTHSTSVPLVHPPPGSRRIALLRGRLKVQVVTRLERLELDPAAAAGPRRAGDIRLTIGAMERVSPTTVRLPITAFRDGRDDDSWAALRLLLDGWEGSITATDAAGWPALVSTTFSQGPDRQSLRGHAQFSPRTRPGERPAARANVAGQPASAPGVTTGPATTQATQLAPFLPVRVVWELPTEVTELDVPVELRDLPLP